MQLCGRILENIMKETVKSRDVPIIGSAIISAADVLFFTISVKRYGLHREPI